MKTRLRSLRFRLLAGTLAALLLALLLAGLLLAGLFREQVRRQFESGLRAQLDQLSARLEFDAQGRPQLDARQLSDPRWSRPYSGLYWQLDEGSGSAPQRGVLRSRSLWDAQLPAPSDALADGAVHWHELGGPDGAPLLLAERLLRPEAAPDRAWRLLVAADLRETRAAARRFNGVLALLLAVLLALLGAAALAQVAVGLAPLRALQRALAAVHAGRAARIEGRFAAEVQPLVEGFNAVLDRNAELVARARAQAGNLAHAVKTPLAALDAAAQRGEAGLAALVREQVGLLRRQVDWHLARARAAAAQGLPGLRTPLAPLLAGLLRVMERVHRERGLRLTAGEVSPALAFVGESQDLQEMLGNLLDNACKWARSEVRIEARAEAGRLRLRIEDDGPGIPTDQRATALARGTRLDESVAGSGLGLAIVQELAGLYGGSLALGDSPLGGLAATLVLPAATASDGTA